MFRSELRKDREKTVSAGATVGETWHDIRYCVSLTHFYVSPWRIARTAAGPGIVGRKPV
jgi:hypothetical protein